MKVDEALLRAYVDGELDPPRREQVEAVLAHSPELQAVADAMRASCLPYRAAYESQALPPLPPGLLDQVSTWSALAASAPPNPGPGASRRRALNWGMGMAASFALGSMLPWRLFGNAPSAPPAAAPWVTAIVGYHALYVRATVDSQADSPGGVQQPQLSAFAPALQLRLRVPDLQPAGLSLRRVQQLGFEGAPLLQMVYLPARGLPAALCVLPVDAADAPLSTRRQAGLGVAAWVDRGLAWVLVADMAADDAGRLAARIQQGEFKPV